MSASRVPSGGPRNGGAAGGGEAHLRLLCLDGGGVRGLFTLMILELLMKQIDRVNPPKPCQVFHLIGGTSTGGLLAIMLGRLRMSIADCKACYGSMVDDIFKKRNLPINWRGKVKGRYSSDGLEAHIKKVLKQRGYAEDELLVTNDGSCKIFVCAVSQENRELDVQFTSYPRPHMVLEELFEKVTIWEAAKATCAATSIFDPVVIGPYGQRFVDGAASSNNPVWRLWEEAQQIWEDPLEPQIQCIVSIGTGASAHGSFGETPKELLKTLIELAKETEKTANSFLSHHQGLASRDAYFRFNELRTGKHIKLDDTKGLKDVAAMAMAYAGNPQHMSYIKRCGQALKEFIAVQGVPATENQLQLTPRLTPKLLAIEDDIQEQGVWELKDAEIAPLKVVNRVMTLNVPDSELSSPSLTSASTITGSDLDQRIEAPRRPGPRLTLFYQLDTSPRYVHHDAELYWDLLTLAGLKEYEKIYEALRDHYTSCVSYKSLIKHLDPSYPPRNLIAAIWRRVDPSLEALLPRNLTMAFFFMLHIETHLDRKPRRSQPRESTTLTERILAMLECYGNWVDCSCGCGRKWSFANGPRGLSTYEENMGQKSNKRQSACRALPKKKASDGKDTQFMRENVRLWFQEPQVPVPVR